MTERRPGQTSSSKRSIAAKTPDPVEAAAPAGPFNFEDPAATRVAYARRRRRTPVWQTLGVWGGVVAVLAAIGYGGWMASQSSGASDKLSLQSPGDQTIDEESPLSFRVGLAGSGFDPRKVEYDLVEAPDGATIDGQSGEFRWTPAEDQGPGSFAITVRVEADQNPSLSDETTFVVAVDEVARPPVVEPIDEQVVDMESAAPVTVDVRADDPDLPASTLAYSLDSDDLPGAAIDSESGRFEWSPKGAEPGLFPVTVRVEKVGSAGIHATHTFYLRVPELEGARREIGRLEAAFRMEGFTVTIRDRETVAGFETPAQVLLVGDDQVLLLPYGDAAAAVDAVARVPAGGGSLLGDERIETLPLKLYRSASLLAVYQGDDEAILGAISAGLGAPVSTIAAVESKPAPPPTAADVETLLAMLDEKTLFNTKQYPEIRKIFADRFENEFAAEIAIDLGDENDSLQKWFDEHRDFEQELYTAIDPEHDDVAGAISLFNDLREQFPEAIEKYGELAIAVAVTWDRERGSVYEYDHHARRTSSNYGGEFLDGAGNFKYFVEAEALMQGRVQFMPHEFLRHLVNHRTPADERAWAMQNYGGRRAMFGQCYSDVPYDNEMLRTSSAVCRLNGQDYVLPNIRKLGGVCAMQADFAARVGKSMGVPAEYVSGESIYGDRHAWVMWIELKNVTQNSISFTLESHGRYRGDKYYVGELDDPQTGRPMTDRDLELRLHTAGINPLAARQAGLVMKAYPLLCEAGDLDQAARLDFLNEVIDLSPGNEAAWQTLAAIPKNETIEKSNRKIVLGSFDRLFRTFANFPDFTWKVFNDLVAFVDDDRERRGLYERLVVLYEAAGRPDLACEARLTLTDQLLAAEETVTAINGLAFTIKKFPDEGRYVPRMLDKLEAICADVPEAGPHLVRFYTEFLPAIPRARGDEPSKYCVEMYDRAVALFRENGQTQLATILSGELAKIQASQ